MPRSSTPFPFALGLVGLVMATTSLAAQEPSVQGRVIDARTRSPVAGALVELARVDETDPAGAGVVVARVLTDDDGRFTFVALPTGRYWLGVEALGYSAEAERVLEYTGEAVRVDVAVAPSPLETEGIDVVVTRPAVVAEETQIISGLILDAESEDPLAELSVSLRTVRGELLGWTTSDADGHFVFAVAEPGLYRLGFTALGYDSTATASVAVARGQDVYVELRAEPTPFGLGEIRVTAPRDLPRLEAVGFYQRRELGRGDFYEPREVREIPAQLTSQLLRQLEGVSVVPGPGIRVWGTTRLCAPDMYLDGLRMGAVEVERLILKRRILAVEVYKRIHEIPQQWRGINGLSPTCGVIAIWTKD